VQLSELGVSLFCEIHSQKVKVLPQMQGETLGNVQQVQ
jgi:hypothetical protein